MNNKHSGLIGKLTVASDKPYIIYDEVHGLVSEHRQLRAAQQALEYDGADCAMLPDGNSHSDAQVYCGDDEDGWCLDITG